MCGARSASTFARGLLFILALGAIPAFVSADNECPPILPADVIPITAPWLCRDGTAEGGELSVCREYINKRHIYLVVFRGGTSPKAVYERARTNQQYGDGLQKKVGSNKRDCAMERPSGVPAGAIYRGTGVCKDEQGRPLPCSLFEYAGAREPEAMRYFIYYDPDGSGVRHIDALSAGRNEHAIEAELAFQLGQALRGTVCCSNRAKFYLTHAAALFPDDGAYRAALAAIRGDDAEALMAAFSRMLEQSR